MPLARAMSSATRRPPLRPISRKCSFEYRSLTALPPLAPISWKNSAPYRARVVLPPLRPASRTLMLPSSVEPVWSALRRSAIRRLLRFVSDRMSSGLASESKLRTRDQRRLEWRADASASAQRCDRDRGPDHRRRPHRTRAPRRGFRPVDPRPARRGRARHPDRTVPVQPGLDLGLPCRPPARDGPVGADRDRRRRHGADRGWGAGGAPDPGPTVLSGLTGSAGGSGCYDLGVVRSGPPSSRGLGRHPFKVEIRGSNPLGGTKLMCR